MRNRPFLSEKYSASHVIPPRLLAVGLSLVLLAGFHPSSYGAEKSGGAENLKQFAYVGTYNPNGEGVYRLQLDPASGELKNKTLVSELANPAQLVADRQGKTLYVASEVSDYNGGQHGSIVAYRIDPQDGGLTLLNQVDAQGAGPVYLSLTPSGSHLFVANYVSGSVAVFPLAADGKIEAVSSVHQDEGPAGAAKPVAAVEGSFAASDHNGPHAHMIASDPSGKFVFSTDLGLDRIYQWHFDPTTGALTPNEPPYISASSAGAGPRHFVFHPNGKVLFLINEEASTLTSYRLDTQKGTLEQVVSVSSLPKEFRGTNFAAGLTLSKDGRFLYVANRLHNSIGLFAVNGEGDLKAIEEVWTRGDYPRTLVLDPSGHYLYAMNQRSDNITRFKVDQSSGELSFIPGYIPVGSPSQMIFTPLEKE
ncbi:lactonase family protein [Yersinia nurmii]|uniref:Hemagglutinin-related protein n=1 Tax=Yersinia nurmii TaxID=685706 RepID=A0AAW7K6Z6_9GAMM|nr:lactonase family protein [Yersinia nurmii]MDN0086385.1 lactonase family protein [Yersinia nurmii]CNE50968.1 putative hemagglutinin-related protein [Yersinia nurmii]